MADGKSKTTEDDEFLHGIWWVSDGARGLRNASPMECATEIRRLRRIEDAAKCIKHWHDHVFPDGSEGMVVSAPHVRALWEALDGKSP